MLFCLRSHFHKNVLANSFGLSPNPTETRQNSGVSVEKHNSVFYFMVTRKVDYYDSFETAQKLFPELMMVIILDKRTSPIPPGPQYFKIETFEEFVEFIPFELDITKLNKIRQDIFYEAEKTPERKKTKIIRAVQEEKCTVCLDNDTNVMFDCGHRCICDKCAEDWNKTCPMCRKFVNTMTYFA